MTFPPASRIVAAVAATSGARSTATTLAPCSANKIALARPMPLAAPVTTADRPSRRFIDWDTLLTWRSARREVIRDRHAHFVVGGRLSYGDRHRGVILVRATVGERIPLPDCQEIGCEPDPSIRMLPVRRMNEVDRLPAGD